jgi:hypothetical protein
VAEQRELVGRKCAGGGDNYDNVVTDKTIQQHDDDDDENKNQNQCDPPFPQAIIASNNNHDDIIGSSTATTTELVGTYTASYRENGKLCNTRTNMVFTPLRRSTGGGRGYAIDGSGSDSDGTFDIIEGLMAPDGQAYWIEQQGSRKILSTGFFTTTAAKTTSSMMTVDGGIIDEYAGTTVPVFFQGQWQSSNGVAASYDSFTLDTTTNQQQHGAVVEHDIEHGAAGGAPAAAYAFGYSAAEAAAVGVAQQYRPTYY